MCFSGSDTSTTQSQPNQAFLDAYKSIFSRAQTVANTPYSSYGGKMVADLSPDQLQAQQQVRDSQGIAASYINSAASYYDKANTPLWQGVQQFSPEAVNQYASPHTASVVDATQRQFDNTNSMQQNDLKGNLISRGAWGGDRAGIAQGVLAGQQAIAQAPVIAGLYDKGYSQALGQFNQQQGTQLGVNQQQAGLGLQTGYGMSALGNQAQTSALAGANALAGSGAAQQQQAQAGLNVPYYQWQAQQAYPFQTTSWLSGIGTGLGGASGGTSSTTSPAPSAASQIGGLATGALGVAGATGAFGSSGWLTSLFKSGGGVVPDERRGIVIPFPGHRARRAAGGPISPLVSLNPSSYEGGIAVPMLRTGTGGGNTQAYLDSQVPGWTPQPSASYNFPLVDFNAPAVSGSGGIGGATGPVGGGTTDGGERNFGGVNPNDGYNGKVETIGQFGKLAAGGITGNLLNIIYHAVRDLPLSQRQGDPLSGGQIEINKGNAGGFGAGVLGGTMGDLATINGQLGSITGGATNTLSGRPAAPPTFSTPPITTAPLPIATYAPAPAPAPDLGGGLSAAQFDFSGPAAQAAAAQAATGALAGLDPGALGDIGDITGGGDRLGGDGGGASHETGHETGAQADGNNAERNFEGGFGARRGGRLHRDMGGLLPRTPWGDLDPGLMAGDVPAYGDVPDPTDDESFNIPPPPAAGIAGDPRGEASWQMPSGGLGGIPAPPASRQAAPGGGGGMGIPPPPPMPPGAPQAGLAGSATPAAAEDAPIKTDPWLSVIKAGAAMMSGRSSNALANLGTGITAGLDDFTQRKVATERAEDRRETIKARREAIAAQKEWRTMSAQQAAERLAAQIAHQNRQLGISGAHLGETQRHNQAVEESAGRPTYVGTDDEGNAIVADKTGIHSTGVKVNGKPMNEYQAGQLQVRKDALALARDRYGRALTNDEEKRIKSMTDAALRVYTTNLQMGNKTSPEDAEKQAAAVRGAVTTRAAPAAPGQPALPKPGEVRDGYRFNGGDPALPGSWTKE